MLTNLQIAKQAKLKPISVIARNIGLRNKDIIPYANYAAKVDLDSVRPILRKHKGKYILVTGINPTPFGEGKTVTSIGLSMALAKKGNQKSIACIRQPSLGPIFGIKGAGTGGGFSQVVPREDLNLHFTGDLHAVGVAHNLCAAFLDNHIYRGNALDIDARNIFLRRVIDINDRALRNIKISVGLKNNSLARISGFDMTTSSEVMSILSLCKSFKDLRKRLGRMTLALSHKKTLITADDLKVSGAMAVLLKDTIKPNLVQTVENTPCFMHTGPFANISHGNTSILADKLALNLSEFVVTESGFGTDCGAEKFFDIKSRISGDIPDCVVLVCSVRAIKMHSNKIAVYPGRPLDKRLYQENLGLLKKGICNLKRHIENIRLFGLSCVVAINRFDSDTDEEIDFLIKSSLEFGADFAAENRCFSKGSEGALELAGCVIKASNKSKNFRYLYDLDMSIREKISIIAKKIYGARSVRFSRFTEEKIRLFNRLKFDKLPVCIAKTHLSLSHDSLRKGAPTDFVIPINDLRLQSGAGFLYALAGKINTMPGLPTRPIGELMDIDSKGNPKGF